MNWSVYSKFVGNVFGAPLAIEGLAAFMLEATFLGVWIFGWNRLSPRVHLATLWIAVAGTWLSAYFILVANSWMQQPGRLRDRGRRGAADERLGAPVQRVRAPRVRAHDPRRPDLRVDRRPRRLLLALPARPQRRPLPQGGEAGADRGGAGHVAPPRRRQPLRHGRDQCPADEDRRLRGPVGHLPAVRRSRSSRSAGSPRTDQTPSFSITDPATSSRTSRPARSTARYRGSTSSKQQDEREYGPRQLHAERARDLLDDAGDGLHRGRSCSSSRPSAPGSLEAEARARALVPLGRRSSRCAFPFVAATAGWILTEVGRQPWIVQGLLQDRRRALARGLLDDARVQPRRVRLPLRAAARARHLADAPLRDDSIRRSSTATRPERLRCLRSATEMDLPAPLVLPGRLLLRRLLRARGLRLRRRDAAAVPAAQRGGAQHDVPHDRPRLGRQRGLARRRRRRDVRGLPGLVRDDVLRLLHRPAAAARVPDRARALVRVARAARALALARPLGLGEHDRQPRRRADLGRRVLEPALRRADQLQRRLRRHLLGPLQPLHAARRGRGRAAVRVPRRDLPDAAHDRRAVPPRRGGRRSALDRDGASSVPGS